MCPACGAANTSRSSILRGVRRGARRRRASDPAPTPARPRKPSGGSSPSCSPTSSALRRSPRTATPEEVRELLSRYFDAARRVIGRYGGTVEKFIGDAVMAVWGAPIAQEDDAERAVRSRARPRLGRSSALGARPGMPGLRLRAGVVTGEAAVTVGAEGQGMVAGDLVNTAVAGADRSRAGHGARGRVDSEDDGGGSRLRGRRRARAQGEGRAGRAVARPAGRRRTRWARAASTGLEAPFVGREAESCAWSRSSSMRPPTRAQSARASR